MDLIKFENNVLVLDKETSQKIAEFEKAIKDMQEKEKALKEAILKEMEAKNIIKIDTPELSITYVAETYKESFDSKLFKEHNPDLYDAYVKISTVKSSLRLKVK